MSDIVHQLRDMQCELPCSPTCCIDPMRAEAADEIERLRAALKPFAACADVAPATCDAILMYASQGGGTYLGFASVGDLRRAKAALGDQQSEDKR